MSDIRLIREPSDIDNTFGVLFIDGYYQCFTLENSHKLIPVGTYDITFYNSPKNLMVVPLLKEVPGRTMIEIHPANLYSELEGCIAPGTGKTNEQILNSRIAFYSIMDKIQKRVNNQITIE